ncbi:OB-fold nucleic acid binding domain-containing protein [Streptomyces durhamensis]|uniref:OB-fold nucleic acid binding domain-containing protein n=1 Tax=Streptomyces durhamensis TaxID=68194 RepID=UPI00068F0708|nr:OB-fold nucleic acid binding domain-containing protein [Streptomyces durhamensis]
MTSEHSLFLMEPDGVERQLQQAVVEAAQKAGLTVVCRHQLLLGEEDIVQAWADTRRAEHPLEHLFLDLWYGGRPMEVLLVEGPDALARANQVKSAVRAGYRMGPFVNVLHSPDHAGEFDLRLSVFGRGCATCSQAVSADFGDYSAVPQAYPPGTLLPDAWRDIDRLREFAQPLWDDPASCFWRPTYPEPYRGENAVGPQDRALYLSTPPHQLSFDNLVGALVTTLPGIDFAHALELIISALHHRDFTLAVGTPAECERYQASLMAQGLNTPIRTLAQDAVAPRGVDTDRWPDGRLRSMSGMSDTGAAASGKVHGHLPGQLADRLAKRAALLAEGIDPYPPARPVGTRVADLDRRCSQLPPRTHTGTTVTVAGRIISRRDHRDVEFATLRDGSQEIQILLAGDRSTGELRSQWRELTDLGDLVVVGGELVTTGSGALAVAAEEFTLAAKALRPLPGRPAAAAPIGRPATSRHRYQQMLLDPGETVRAHSRGAVLKALREGLYDPGVH